MAQPLSDAQIKIYRQTALARAQSRREHLAVQRQKARELAQRAAAVLKEEFGVTLNFCLFLERLSRPDEV